MKKLINPLALLNKKGQMAVFIVLIFQVLFVLFAMVINIGLIVHDKINLQNSVDLAAYYVAQRQAESLNAIAHQNYQIRQAWKLLAFRYFVLGTSSMTDSAAGSGNNTGLVHPAAVGKTYSNTDIEGCFDNFQTYTNPSTKSPPGKCHKLPVICISDIYPWKIITKGGVASKDQFCRNLTLTVSSLTAPSNIASFTGVGKTIANVNTFNKILTDTCIYAENMQLVYASSILTAFDREQSNRLKILYSLAKLLGNNKDIDGKSLKAGARKVLNKNLSYANFKGSNKDLKLFNSVDGTTRSEWLVPIVVNPAIIFAKFDNTSGCNSANAKVLGSDGTDKTKRTIRGTAFKDILQGNYETAFFLSETSLGKIGGRKSTQITAFVDDESPATKEPNFLSVGVEKNPWYRVYAGITASSSPRELFWVGKSVKLKATAFATPFGGRIGPWYGKDWDPEGRMSNDGTERNNRVDKLLPPRDLLRGKGNHTKSLAHEFIPNFSRFPGDEMGLFSSEALAAVKLIGVDDTKFSVDTLFKAAFTLYEPVDGLIKLTKTQSTLSYSEGTKSPRKFERAAISPNLFDITYYSVFPNAMNSFMGRLRKLSEDNNKIIEVRDDVGNYVHNQTQTTTLKERIKGIGKKSTTLYNGVTIKPSYGRFITKPQKVLTAWIPNGAYTYTFNNTAFQKCKGWSEGNEDKPPVIGDCYSGGRVGYSVKIISRDALNSDKIKIGIHTGKLKNPPPPPDTF